MLTGNYSVQSGHRETLSSAKGKIFYGKSDPSNGFPLTGNLFAMYMQVTGMKGNPFAMDMQVTG